MTWPTYPPWSTDLSAIPWRTRPVDEAARPVRPHHLQGVAGGDAPGRHHAGGLQRLHRLPDLLPEFSQFVGFRPAQIPQPLQPEPMRTAGRGPMAGDVTVQPFGEIALKAAANFPIEPGQGVILEQLGEPGTEMQNVVAGGLVALEPFDERAAEGFIAGGDLHRAGGQPPDRTLEPFVRTTRGRTSRPPESKRFEV
jgi:hypothetical protein